MEGALTSYQSLREKGSTLRSELRSALISHRALMERRTGTHVFFFPPFLPLEIRLFLPTAMLGNH